MINSESRKRKLPGYLNDEEFIPLLKSTKNPNHKVAFTLGYMAGLRVGEIVHLTKDDIDFENKRIFIRDGKGGKDRVVPLPKGFPKKFLPLFPLNVGIRALQISFKKKLKEMNITKPNLRFHSLRHSFAIRCMKQGIPLNQIQILLGHENISTTSIYLRINPQDALKSYEELW